MLRIMLAVAIVAVVAACGDGATAESPLAVGKQVYADTCAVCHGSTGGGGAGPALDLVVATWPSCADQIEWIRLGSEGWREERGPTYGASNKAVAGGMPAQAQKLLDSEIAAVAAFERVRYGGEDEAAALAACGVDSSEPAG